MPKDQNAGPESTEKIAGDGPYETFKIESLLIGFHVVSFAGFSYRKKGDTQRKYAHKCIYHISDFNFAHNLEYSPLTVNRLGRYIVKQAILKSNKGMRNSCKTFIVNFLQKRVSYFYV